MDMKLGKLWEMGRTGRAGMLQSMEFQTSDMTGWLNNNQ